VPAERITTLHGILLDFDPVLIDPENPYFRPDDDPRAFYSNIRPVLDRHPLARNAEVRSSGSGLHVIIWLDPPVELGTTAEQKEWATIVRTVQCTLPADLNAPGITALTRPLGSVNSQNRALVELFCPGKAVEGSTVKEFVNGLAKSPFKQAALILLGETCVSPCPSCQCEGSRLEVGDNVGFCYNGCGKVEIKQLYDRIYAPAAELEVGKRAAHATGRKQATQRQCTAKTQRGKGGRKAKS
jgi:hypothetical protein